MPETRWTIYVCDKGHVAASSVRGVCWNCYPGGRRTWERCSPKQIEPNQRRIEVLPASYAQELRAAAHEYIRAILAGWPSDRQRERFAAASFRLHPDKEDRDG
jgi:hypothetical protein